MIRKTYEEPITDEEGSTINIINAIWPDKISENQNGSCQVPISKSPPSDLEMKDRFLFSWIYREYQSVLQLGAKASSL